MLRDSALRGSFTTVPERPSDDTMQDLLDRTNHERPKGKAIFAAEYAGRDAAVRPRHIGGNTSTKTRIVSVKGIRPQPFTHTPANTALGSGNVYMAMAPHGMPVHSPGTPAHSAFGE